MKIIYILLTCLVLVGCKDVPTADYTSPEVVKTVKKETEDTNPVPEPASIVILGLGAIALVFINKD